MSKASNGMPTSTQSLRDEVLAIWERQKAGTITVKDARMQLAAAKMVIETMKLEISAASLGVTFRSAEFDEVKRLKLVA